MDDEPDYRFTLAAERTYLSYVRTALALFAGSIATLGYFDSIAYPALAFATGVGLFAVGALALIAGHIRWVHIDRAIRRGQRLPTNLVPSLITTALGLVATLGLVALLIGI